MGMRVFSCAPCGCGDVIPEIPVMQMQCDSDGWRWPDDGVRREAEAEAEAEADEVCSVVLPYFKIGRKNFCDRLQFFLINSFIQLYFIYLTLNERQNPF